MLSQRSHFAKWFTKTASAPLVELFVELKPKKNGFTSEVKPYQTGPYFTPFGRKRLQAAPEAAREALPNGAYI